MTFYELSATNSRGQSFTLALHGAQDLIALAELLRQSSERTGRSMDVAPHEEFQVQGDLLAAVLGAHAGDLTELSVEWFDGAKHWRSNGAFLSEASNLGDSWSVLYGDY